MTFLRHELETPADRRRVGSGWLSGVAALALSLLGLGAVLCLRYPDVLTMPEARGVYDVRLIRLAVHAVLIGGFLAGVLSVVLRRQKGLGLTALSVVLAATLLGGSAAQTRTGLDADVFFGLDWFLLNLTFTGVVFIPIERLFGRRDQPVFRYEWREDLFYLLVSSLLVQSLTFLSLAPSTAILAHTEWAGLRRAVGGQPLVLQFFEIVVLTDLAQYWVHRTFHRVPFLWKFHAVHHSAETMDWLAGSRMHLLEVIVLRGVTVVPMYVLGFAGPALYAYIFFVYVYSTLVHANLRLDLRPVEWWVVTPRFHHWHHGIEREAIDVNFAVHLPLLDRLFGTHHLPADGAWPAGYGIAGHPVPKGFLRQFLSPFVRERAAAPPTTTDVTTEAFSAADPGRPRDAAVGSGASSSRV